MGRSDDDRVGRGLRAAAASCRARGPSAPSRLLAVDRARLSVARLRDHSRAARSAACEPTNSACNGSRSEIAPCEHCVVIVLVAY